MTEDEENFLKGLIVICYSNNMKKEAQKIIENERNLEKRKTETRNLLIEEHERTEKLVVKSKALKEKISTEIQTEKTKGKKQDDQLKTAIRLAKIQKTNLESQLIEKNQARIRKIFSKLNSFVFFFKTK